MKIVKQWLPEQDTIGWRVVTDIQAVQLESMVGHVYTVPEFIQHCQRQGCFTVTRVPGSTVRDAIYTVGVIVVGQDGTAVVTYELQS